MRNNFHDMYRNDMYNFIRRSIISFYTKCLDNPDNEYYQSFLKNGLKMFDYTGFLEDMYKNYYKEKD